MIKSLKTFLESAESALDISSWKSKPGSQLGSNAGGIHLDETGQKHYVKFPRDPEQARQEAASSKIHALLGVNTLGSKLVQRGGKLGVATKWNDDLETKSPRDFENLTADQAAHVARIHHAGVITKNWDTVGLEHDNIMFHKKTGVPHAVDQGGSLNYRAQGGHKDFGNDIGEVKSYRDNNINPQAAHVFKHAFSAHPGVEKNELVHAKKLTYDDAHSAFAEVGVKNAKELAKTVINRRDKLLQHYGV